MPTRIRLQRYGKKHKPFYHIVIADGRAPRDGKFIETIGTYNPLTNPADVVLDFDKALDWLQKGAEPSDTVRSILSYKGVIYKNHLLKGVKKGAMTEEQAEATYNVWLKEKNEKISKKTSDVQLGIIEKQKEILANESKINEAKANAIAKRKADELEKQVEKAKEDAAPEAIEEKAEAKEEVTKAVEEKKEEVTEAKEAKKEEPVAEVVAEKKEEVVAEEKKEADAKEDTDKKEDKK